MVTERRKPRPKKTPAPSAEKPAAAAEPLADVADAPEEMAAKIASDTRDEISSREPTALSRKSIGAGRVGAYAALGALATVIPLPVLPDAGSKRIRGALAFDIAARHGISLSNEARKILEEPWSSSLPKGLIAQAARFAAGRFLSRLGPLGFLSPIRSGLMVFLFGMLFERYLETARTERAIRMDIEEARKVRKAMDRALLLVLTVKTEGPFSGGSTTFAPRPPEELRTSANQLADSVILAAAGIPEWLVARLEAAFDESLASVGA